MSDGLVAAAAMETSSNVSENALTHRLAMPSARDVQTCSIELVTSSGRFGAAAFVSSIMGVPPYGSRKRSMQSTRGIVLRTFAEGSALIERGVFSVEEILGIPGPVRDDGQTGRRRDEGDLAEEAASGRGEVRLDRDTVCRTQR